MTRPHHLAPFRLAEGQDRPALAGQARGKHDDVDLDMSPVGRVRDDARGNLAGQAKEGSIVASRVLPAERFEVGADHLRQEGALRILPDRGGLPLLQQGPRTPHHRLIEHDQRLDDPEGGAP